MNKIVLIAMQRVAFMPCIKCCISNNLTLVAVGCWIRYDSCFYIFGNRRGHSTEVMVCSVDKDYVSLS